MFRLPNAVSLQYYRQFVTPLSGKRKATSQEIQEDDDDTCNIQPHFPNICSNIGFVTEDQMINKEELHNALYDALIELVREYLQDDLNAAERYGSELQFPVIGFVPQHIVPILSYSPTWLSRLFTDLPTIIKATIGAGQECPETPLHLQHLGRSWQSSTQHVSSLIEHPHNPDRRVTRIADVTGLGLSFAIQNESRLSAKPPIDRCSFSEKLSFECSLSSASTAPQWRMPSRLAERAKKGFPKNTSLFMRSLRQRLNGLRTFDTQAELQQLCVAFLATGGSLPPPPPATNRASHLCVTVRFSLYCTFRTPGFNTLLQLDESGTKLQLPPELRLSPYRPYAGKYQCHPLELSSSNGVPSAWISPDNSADWQAEVTDDVYRFVLSREFTCRLSPTGIPIELHAQT